MAMASNKNNNSSQMNKSYILYCCIHAGLYVFVSSSVVASEFSFSLFERVEHSDNIRLVSDSEESDTILETGFAMGYINDTQKFPTSFQLAVSYRDYLNDSYEDENNISADINSKWIVNPRRFEWEIIDRYQLLPIDIQTPDTPDNQEFTNYFSTGPNIFVVNTRRSRVSLSLRYEDFYFEESNEDRKDFVGRLNWLYSLSSKSRFGLHGVSRNARFEDNIANIDYDREDYFASLAYGTLTTSFAIEAGQTILKPENRPEEDTDLMRVKLLKNFTSQSVLSLVYNKELSDFSTLTTRTEAGTEIPTDISSEIFLLEEIIGTYTRRTGWGGASVSYAWRDYDYADAALDRVSNRADILLDIVSDPSLSYQVNYAYTDYDWSGIDRIDKERVFLVGALKKFTDIFSSRFSVQHTNNDSNISTFGYTENRVFLDLNVRLK